MKKQPHKRKSPKAVETTESGMTVAGTEAVYRYMISSLTEYAIFAISTTGKVLSWNPGAERHFGYTSQEILGQQYDVFFSAQDRSEKGPEGEMAAAAREGRVDYERWHVRKDGTQFWGTNTVQPLYDDTNHITGFTKIVRDTSKEREARIALSQSEERLRLLIESVKDYAIFSTTPDGSITLWNPGAERLFGYSAADILGRTFVQLFTDEDISLGAPQRDLYEANSKGSCTTERVLVRKDRLHFFAESTLTPIESEASSSTPGFVNVTHDVTLRKQLEDDQQLVTEELARARDEALSTAKLKTQFFAAMSHEIRTPISGVIGMGELLLLTQLTPEQREYADVIRDSGEALLRVINDILDFSKIEAGKLNINAVQFQLAAEIASVIDLLTPQAEQKKIGLTSSLDPRLPRELVGDPGRLRQVLLNLVGNALKFTPPLGSVVVEATSIPTEDEQISIRFDVRDDGIGIDPAVQSNLFQPFTQADGSTNSKFGGTGLGLSISKQLVALMGGTIGVESELDRGSTFWFLLSFSKATVRVDPATPETAQVTERKSATRRKEKILLVEDNAVILHLAKRQFETLGFDLTTVTNGRRGVEAVLNDQYDLVFMDCNMPEMNGFEATKEIRLREGASAKRLPIVALTADARAEDRDVCLAAGMDDYLSKPCSLAGIKSVLDRWLPEAD